MLSQEQETLIEFDLPVSGVFQNSGFLVINQHLGTGTTKPFKRTDRTFVGVFSIIAKGCERVEATRVAQDIHGDIDLSQFPRNLDKKLTPVVLQLVAGSRYWQ